MLSVLLERLRGGRRTLPYPRELPVLPERFRGLPDDVQYLSHFRKRQPLGRPTVECCEFNCGQTPRGLP
jgi:hypothetical protein